MVGRRVECHNLSKRQKLSPEWDMARPLQPGARATQREKEAQQQAGGGLRPATTVVYWAMFLSTGRPFRCDETGGTFRFVRSIRSMIELTVC